MILRLIRKSELGQSERSYARAVMEYIATLEVALLNKSGHKKGIVEKCSHYEVHVCTPGLNLCHQAKKNGILLHTGARKRERLDVPDGTTLRQGAGGAYIEVGKPARQSGIQHLAYLPIAPLL